MDGAKRPRLEEASEQVENPLNLSLDVVKPEYPSTGLALTEMRSRFQQWVLKTYRDSSKTKTITSDKYERIVKTLAGEIKNCAENSKFRFWMKCKGFKVAVTDGGGKFLLVQDKKGEEIKYKKVAVVENFFDIIYDVHVNEGARGMKHAGQKRTHRMITETYAFLPREAVTKFLLCCTDCQKRLNEDRKQSPTSSSDSIQPHPTDLQDFHSLPHTVLDQTPTRPSSPSSTYACNYAPVIPALNHKHNNNDLYSQPYDYSTRLSPENSEADSIRTRRKRKVTRKIVQLDAEYENDDVLDYSSSKPYLECSATARVPSMEIAEQISQADTPDSESYKFSATTPPHANLPENMSKNAEALECNTSSCKRQCPFIEKISEVLYNPVKYARNAHRQTDFSPMNEDYLEQSAVDLLVKAHQLESTKEVLTEDDREQIILKIYSCRIISFLLSYAADVMLRVMVDDQISS